MRQDQIIQTFHSGNFNQEKVLQRLKALEYRKIIKRYYYDNNLFWKLNIIK